MARKQLTADKQVAVLKKSRRRCCICYGLNRDTSIKQGQIAHLDKNSANDAEDNLAFLCLVCHDRYDSNSSQSKNYTVLEVKEYRRELEEALTLSFAQPVQFGQAEISSLTIDGHYIRTGPGDSAELMVKQLPSGQVRVSGEALWGTNRKYGPNIGTLDFLADLEGNAVIFQEELGSSISYQAELTFHKGSLDLVENGVSGYFGMNVTFGGSYIKVS